MKTNVSNMLESTLLRLNQTYEIESIQSELKYTENMIEINNTIVLPVGSFIKISGARYNNGIFEIMDITEDGYMLDKNLINGFETADISPLNIPFGLLDIIRQMCIAIDGGANDNLKSLSVDGVGLVFDERSVFGRFSRALSAYKRLKTV